MKVCIVIGKLPKDIVEMLYSNRKVISLSLTSLQVA